jgi:Carboxypeptidase regulatory-like domain
MRSRILASTFVLLIGVSWAVSFTYGQAVTGSFTGHVYDPSGAPVPNATVVATNVLTGIATTRSSDSAGLYLITNLLPGTYSVAVEAKGFKRFVQENIVLRVDSKMNIDAQLELGEITQEVTVSAAPPMLQTEKADVNVVLPEQTIENLPTIGRNITRLHLLAPGTSEFIFQIPAGENPALGANVVTNGQFWGSNDRCGIWL